VEATPARTPLRDQLKRALVESMRSRDMNSIAPLRTALSAIDNAEAVEVDAPPSVGEGPIAYATSGVGTGDAARRELTEADVISIVQDEIAERDGAALSYDRLGREAEADRLRREADVLRRQLAVSAGACGPCRPS